MRAVLTFITDFGDQAVILPIFGAVAVVLAIQRGWQVTLTWIVCVVGVIGSLTALKLVCYACMWHIPELGTDALNLRSPSGHTGSAAMVYGGIASVMAGRTDRRIATLYALTAAFALGTTIAITRLLLHVHSLSEVIVGLSIGVTGAVAFAVWSGERARARSPRVVLAVIVALLALTHGYRLPAEAVLMTTGVNTIRIFLPVCAPA